MRPGNEVEMPTIKVHMLEWQIWRKRIRKCLQITCSGYAGFRYRYQLFMLKVYMASFGNSEAGRRYKVFSGNFET